MKRRANLRVLHYQEDYREVWSEQFMGICSGESSQYLESVSLREDTLEQDAL